MWREKSGGFFERFLRFFPREYGKIFPRQKSQKSSRNLLPSFSLDIADRLFAVITLFCLASCTTKTPWVYESLGAGASPFDSARLTFSDAKSPLRFELVRLESGTEAFISLMRYQFPPSGPVRAAAAVLGEIREEDLPCLEGKMRLKLTESFAAWITDALQDGKEVVIMVDGFEQRLEPERFAMQYKKLTGRNTLIRNPFKGIFDP